MILKSIKLGWPILDQFSASIAMLMLVSSVARSVGVGDFGRFALMQLFVASMLLAYRQVPGSWLLVGAEKGKGATSGSLTAALLIGGFCSLVSLLLALVLNGDALECMLVLAVTPIFHYGFETVRLSLVRDGRLERSASLNVLLLISTAFAYFITWLTHSGPLAVFVVYASTLLLIVATAAIKAGGPSVQSAVDYVRRYSHGWRAQLATAFLQVIPTVATPYAVGVGGGAAVVGAIRAAQSINGVPLQVVQGVQPVFLARISERYRKSGQAPVSLYVAIVSFQLCAVVAYGLAMMVIPDWVMKSVLGESWSSAESVLYYLLLAATFGQCFTLIEMHFRVVDELAFLARFSAPAIGVSVVAAGIGAAVGGAVGASIAVLVLSAVRVIIGLVAVILLRARMNGQEAVRTDPTSGGCAETSLS